MDRGDDGKHGQRRENGLPPEIRGDRSVYAFDEGQFEFVRNKMKEYPEEKSKYPQKNVKENEMKKYPEEKSKYPQKKVKMKKKIQRFWLKARIAKVKMKKKKRKKKEYIQHDELVSYPVQ